MAEVKLSGPEMAPASGERPKQLIVFLHGVGADGNDLISFAGELKGLFPTAHFIAPNGPEKCDMSPSGYQWFSLSERTREKMLRGAKTAAPIVNSFLDEQLKRFGLEDKNLALVGFSQGTMMSIYAGLRRQNPVAGILGYSGIFLHSPELLDEVKSKPPVCLVHGTYDQIVPFAAMEDAKEKLASLGVPVDAHMRPGLGHGIDPEGLQIGIKFLAKNLK